MIYLDFLLGTFMGKLKTGCRCLFLKFFDKKEHLEDFLRGTFRITNPIRYRDKEYTELWDKSEGRIFEIFKIEGKESQKLNLWDGSQLIFFTDSAIKNGHNIKDGDDLSIEKDSKINVFCCTFVTDDIKEEDIEKLFSYYKSKGKKYCAAFNIYFLLKEISKNYLISAGEVIYDNFKKPNPFVKTTDFSIENEYRIAFLNIEEEYTSIHVNNLPSLYITKEEVMNIFYPAG